VRCQSSSSSRALTLPAPSRVSVRHEVRATARPSFANPDPPPTTHTLHHPAPPQDVIHPTSIHHPHHIPTPPARPPISCVSDFIQRLSLKKHPIHPPRRHPSTSQHMTTHHTHSPAANTNNHNCPPMDGCSPLSIPIATLLPPAPPTAIRLHGPPPHHPPCDPLTWCRRPGLRVFVWAPGWRRSPALYFGNCTRLCSALWPVSRTHRCVQAQGHPDPGLQGHGPGYFFFSRRVVRRSSHLSA
jgi:hypothetical protein